MVHSSSPPSGILASVLCQCFFLSGWCWSVPALAACKPIATYLPFLPYLRSQLVFPPSSIPFRLRHFLFALASTFCRRLFRFHGRGYVVRQRHAAGATPSATATAARRVADVFDARSARRQHLDIDTGWWSEFSKVSRFSRLDLLLEMLNSFFRKTTSVACMRGEHLFKSRCLLPNLDIHESPVPST